MSLSLAIISSFPKRPFQPQVSAQPHTCECTLSYLLCGYKKKLQTYYFHNIFLSCFNQLFSTVHMSVFCNLLLLRVWHFLLSKLRRLFRQRIFFTVYLHSTITLKEPGSTAAKITNNKIKYVTCCHNICGS